MLSTNELRLPYWFKILKHIKEYDFYFRRMPEQCNFYKQRIFLEMPKWLKFIIPYLPNLWFLSRFYKPKQEHLDILKTWKPDLIIATSLMFYHSGEDILYALAANSLNIPLWGIAPTWDCLTNKSFTWPMPDLMFCWNESHKNQLVEYHNMVSDKIKVIGAYKFESFLEPYALMRKDKFHAKYEFSEKEKTLLYVCSSPTVYGDESDFIYQLAKVTGKQILIQLHPDKVKNINLKETQQIKFSVTDSRDNYHYCEEVWGINTSAFLEAGLLGKPIKVITLPIDGFGQQDSIHFKTLPKNKIKEWLFEDKLPSELFTEALKSVIIEK